MSSFEAPVILLASALPVPWRTDVPVSVRFSMKSLSVKSAELFDLLGALAESSTITSLLLSTV